MNSREDARGDENSLDEVVKRHILKTLEECNYNVSAAARRVKRTRQTIQNYLNEWGFKRRIIEGKPPGSKPPKK